METSRFVSEACQFPSTQVLGYKVNSDGDDKRITLTLIGKVLPTDSLNLALASQLPAYGLKGYRLSIVQGDAPLLSDGLNNSVKDVYQLAQSTISSQQNKIDSLKSIIARDEQDRDLSIKIAPEIRVLFPQIDDIAINRTVFSELRTDKVDTVNLALVVFKEGGDASLRQKLREYLEARLKLDSVRIITIAPGERHPALKPEGGHLSRK